MVFRVAYTPLPPLGAAVEYEYGKFSSPEEATLQGVTRSFELFNSRIYPGTHRDVWLHVPPGVDTTSPLNYCVFQDGWLYLDPHGPIRAGIVLDNLHTLGLIPPTVGIFVDPGKAVRPRDVGTTKQRNIEYDPFTPAYGNFLRKEVLPAVAEHVSLTSSPIGNFICGGSSGGNCAFTAAWYHQDLFEVAICFVSSFAQMPGGNPVPRALDLHGAPPRRLRVFQQIALRDLNWDKADGNWVAENFRVAAALLEHGHDLRCVLGDGGHSPNHGGVLLPDALMWAAGAA
ncbi:alpha/beta hydrolase [Streptomyces sp. NPDC127117]|uniref:alpha/beta hydrolase n=1 Tax=Streptomyces sp. NPDC127117 TaxID=3345368 RepID=UPI00363CD7B1